MWAKNLENNEIAPHLMAIITETVVHHNKLLDEYNIRRKDHALVAHARWIRCNKTSDCISGLMFVNR